MNGDDLIKEMQRVANAFKAPDQTLELDIQSVVNGLRSQVKLPREQIEALENILHHPETLTWKQMPGMSEKETDFRPNEEQIEFFREMIRTATDGAEWGVPSTGQVYKIDKKAKTFTLIRETENDPDDWHGKNKVILALLGWRMIDTRSSTRSFSAERDGWMITVFDFSIEGQENTSTPGQNFPPGSRGQDAVAMQLGAVVRMGHVIGKHLIKHTSPDYGIGKSTAGGSKLKSNDETQ